MTEPLTACPCDSLRFFVSENYGHHATLLPDGTLTYKSRPDFGGRDRIACAQCERDFSDDDFKAVTFD